MSPAWALKKLESGKPVHRFLVGAWARDHLSHIEDFLAEAVKAARSEANPLHKAATEALRGLPRTGVEQAYRVANEWFRSVARQDENDIAALKKFKPSTRRVRTSGATTPAIPSGNRRKLPIT